MLWSHTLLLTVMWTCSSPCPVHPKQNLFMRSQEQLVFVCWLLGKFKSQPYEGETAPLSFRRCCVWNCSGQFCGQGFNNIFIPHCFPSLLLVRMSSALACSLTKLCLWHWCCQARVIPVEAVDQLSITFIFWVKIVYVFIYYWCN